jgi:hypothetical protein
MARSINEAIKAGAKVSTVLKSNHSPLFLAMFAKGEIDGKGSLAKLEAAQYYAAQVKAKAIEANDATALDAARGYDAGKAKAMGREPSSDVSLRVFKSQLLSFASDHALKLGAASYKAADKAFDDASDDDAENMVSDRFQRYLKVNTALKDAKAPIATAKEAAAVITKKPAEKSVETLAAALYRDAIAIRDAKTKLTKDQDAAMKAIIAAFAPSKKK